MEAQNTQSDRNTLIPRQVECVVEPGLAFLVVQFHKARMSRCCVLNRFQGRSHFLCVHEVDYCSLGIAPGQVRQKLIDGLHVILCTAPKLSLCDENIGFLISHEDIGLATLIESLSAC